MTLTTLQDARLLYWLNGKLGTSFHADNCRWIAGLDEPGGVIFVLVYSRISARGCELTIATDGSKRWATRRSLRLIFGIPFNQWKLRRLTVIVEKTNPASMAVVEGLSFVREGVLRKAFAGDVDGIVYGLLREDCKWT